jgi:hypothetical protein
MEYIESTKFIENAIFKEIVDGTQWWTSSEREIHMLYSESE